MKKKNFKNTMTWIIQLKKYNEQDPLNSQI